MSKHTPGPWKADGDRIFSDRQRTEYKSSTTIAVTWDYTAESLANAHLIAAAPEMLEALERISAAFIDSKELKAAYDHANAVIKKAKGE